MRTRIILVAAALVLSVVAGARCGRDSTPPGASSTRTTEAPSSRESDPPLPPAAQRSESRGNSTAGTKKKAILKYLKGLPSRKKCRLIAGQFVGHASPKKLRAYFDELVTRLKKQTGHAPGLLEINLFHIQTGAHSPDTKGLVRMIEAQWAKGVLLYISLRPPNPETGRGWHHRMKGEPIPKDLSTVYTRGTRQNRQYLRTLSTAADLFQALEKKGIVVLFEPFNEIGHPANWFVHDKLEKGVRLWKYTHDYFTRTRGLTNLIWVWEWHAGQSKHLEACFPGRKYADIVGLSLYDSDPRGKHAALWRRLRALGLPLAFTEFGPKLKKPPRPDKRRAPFFTWDNKVQLAAFKEHYPEAVFFIRWRSIWAIVNQKNARAFMSDPRVIDLDRLRKDRAAGDW